MAMTGSGPSSVYTLGLVLCIGFAIHVWRKHQLRGGLPLPPGPRGLPLVGSTFDLNPDHPWLTYEKWAKEYGGIVYVNLVGKHFIIITNAKVAHDLLDQRSAIYSERPYMPANELFGMEFNSGLLPYGNRWRLHRKLLNTPLNKISVRQFQPVAISKARQLVENLLDLPEQYEQHFRTLATATIMAVNYGYEVAPQNDPFVTKIRHFIQLSIDALTPEMAALLLAFPFLAYIPSWMPGGGWKRQAPECCLLAKEVLTGPVQWVMDNMANGTAKKSFVSMLLETEDSKENEDAIRAVATSGFLGGAETTDSTLKVFMLAMVLHPEVQAKAWEELDRVVGNGRLPEFADRRNLPYIEAICLETFRWFPIVPNSLPHMTADSDIYEGMYIPKGAIVLPCIWAIAHEEARFDDPLAFRPERHLTPEGALAEGTASNSFGFGRRACPGRHLADQNLWAAFVTMLATLRFEKARDEFGNEIEVKVEFTSGIATAPKPFKCSITPRSVCAENLIRMRNEERH